MGFQKKTWSKRWGDPAARLNDAAMNDLEGRIEAAIAEIGGGGDLNPPWTEIELDPLSFLAYTPGYMPPAWRWIEPLGVVEVRGGLIAVNNLPGNDRIVQLPTQYAPPQSIDFPVLSNGGTMNRITIDASGDLVFVEPQQQGEVWHLGSAIRWNVPAS